MDSMSFATANSRESCWDLHLAIMRPCSAYRHSRCEGDRDCGAVLFLDGLQEPGGFSSVRFRHSV